MAESVLLLTLYSLLMWLLQPFVRRKLYRRAMLEPLYGERMHERFGDYAPFLREPLRPLVWIHAVSLGETRAASILLKELRVAIPTVQLLLTNGTATGRAEGAKLLTAGDLQVWQPWDTKGVTQQFFKHFKPCVGILMETEIWPNLIASANAANVAVVLANARMSDKTLGQTLRLKWIASQAYHGLAKVYAQTSDDANRLMKVGAKVDGVFGNLKFDVTPNAEQLAQATVFRATLAKPVVLFASSREGEEQLFLNALQALSDAAYSNAYWLIVPRHPQRFDEVAEVFESAGFAVKRRSKCADFQAIDFEKRSTNGKVIWLGDTLGEMTFYSSLASAALLGGSFERLGGQNLIEILACGCPVVMGPYTYNFAEAAQLAASANVALGANDLKGAITLALALSASNGFDARLASEFVSSHRGAAVQTAAAIAATLPANYSS